MMPTRWDQMKQWWCKRFGHRVVRDEWGVTTCMRCLILLGGPESKLADLRDEVWALRSDLAKWHDIVEKKNDRIEQLEAVLRKLRDAPVELSRNRVFVRDIAHRALENNDE